MRKIFLPGMLILIRLQSTRSPHTQGRQGGGKGIATGTPNATTGSCGKWSHNRRNRGRHRYCHKLYALDVVLKELEGANQAALPQAMEGHIVAEATLIGTYQKRK